ncbi:MAG: MFS transporter [Anaerolineales bacterium]|nr:MFS transporter [Anaerolineales bacterium]
MHHLTPQDAATDYTQLPGYKNRWWGLFFICVSLLVIAIDNTILNVALPSISRDLEASASDLQWIIDAYALVFAALLLTMGTLGDRFGRKPALQIGLAWFAVGSLAAALSSSTEMLIGSRAFLGAGAAIIMPATLSLITSTFPPHERSQAIAMWAAVFGLGVGIGPVAGGWLIERYEWNAVFFVNLPVIVFALIGGQMLLTNSKDEAAPQIDIPGVLLSIPGLFALVYGIIKAGETSWTDGTVIASFAVSAILLGIFAIWESRSKNAMLPLELFRNMSFTGANTAVALVMFSMFGSVFFLSQYFQSVHGYSPFDAGLRVVPMAFVLTIAAALSAQVAKRIGTKYTVALGIFIAGMGMLFMSQMYDVETPYSTILLGMAILGAGMGTAMSPATDSIMGSVPPSKAGVGSAMNDTTRELGGAMGVAVLGTVMNTAYLNGVDGLGAQFQLPSTAVEAIESSIQGAHAVAEGFAASGAPGAAQVSQAIIDAANQAFVSGMSEAMFVASLVMVGASILVLFILPNRVRSYDEMSVEAEQPEGIRAKPVPAIGD